MSECVHSQQLLEAILITGLEANNSLNGRCHETPLGKPRQLLPVMLDVFHPRIQAALYNILTSRAHPIFGCRCTTRRSTLIGNPAIPVYPLTQSSLQTLNLVFFSYVLSRHGVESLPDSSN